MTDQTPLELKPLVSQVSDIAQPPLAGHIESTAEAGLELKARSQWSYARQRFLRHRLAMAGLVGLLAFFAIGIFANYIAPYPIDAIDLEHVLIAPTTYGHH
jgi:ABC-type dipeptide/oligopeptide/nickel transport system permease subunit